MNQGEDHQDSAAPAHGQQVISACAFVHHTFDGVTKLFLARRAATKKFLPGIYEIPGGHIDYGEDIVDGLMREIQEEVHMHARIGDPFWTFTYRNAIKGSHTIETVYFATFTDPLDTVQLNPLDHSDYGWFSRAEVEAMHDQLVANSEHFIYDKTTEDPEYLGLLRGFDLLEGKPMNFGN